MIEDAELLRQFADKSSGDAFAELVQRRVDLVYSVALRSLAGDAHLAEDVTQQVFIDLARKASALCQRPVLSGWLYRSAQFAASRAVRAEQRRRSREQEAERMKLNQTETEIDWERLRPVIDEAMGTLAEAERDAVSLRFFESRSFAEIGHVLRLTEDAARKRVERALGKMHTALARRGIGSTVASLSAALAVSVGTAAPAGLATATTSAAIMASGGAKGVMSFFAMTKLQCGLAAAVVLAGAMGITSELREQERLHESADRVAAAASQIPGLKSEVARLEAMASEMADLRRLDPGLPRLREAVMGLRRQRAASSTSKSGPTLADAGPAGAVEAVAQLDRLPVARFRTPPTYPQSLREAGIGGDVLVACTVDANGEMADVRAVKSTRPEFEQAAVEAVKQWEFKPGQKHQREVNARILVPIVFRMENDEYEPATLAAGITDGVLLDPFHVSASAPKPGEPVPPPARTWF